VFECVPNLAEGRDLEVLDELARCAGPSLRDRHFDDAHHRSVFTLINQPDPLRLDLRNLVRCAFDRLTLRGHEGVHPRFGVVDVVPFVALDPDQRDLARHLRDETARWIAHTFDVATFLYGPLDDGSIRSLPEVRRLAFGALRPDFGPTQPSPLLGAVAVGERPVLVAWNLWLADTSLASARELARGVRSEFVRALGLRAGDQVQVSCNLLDVARCAPSMVFDHVRERLWGEERITRCELVGLAPRSLLEREDPARWSQLDLSPERTIERTLEGGSASL
jgi:glutamate formiminotransferase